MKVSLLTKIILLANYNNQIKSHAEPRAAVYTRMHFGRIVFHGDPAGPRCKQASLHIYTLTESPLGFVLFHVWYFRLIHKIHLSLDGEKTWVYASFEDKKTYIFYIIIYIFL